MDTNDKLNPDQLKDINKLLIKHESIFSTGETDIGFCDLIKHRIDLVDGIPFKQKTTPSYDSGSKTSFGKFTSYRSNKEVKITVVI